MASGNHDAVAVNTVIRTDGQIERSPENIRSQALVEGPFDTNELIHIDEALTNAHKLGGGLTYSVYVGGVEGDMRPAVEAMHERLVNPDSAVLIVLSPQRRELEIVTGAVARKLIPDRSAALAVFSMEAELNSGKLCRAVVTGLRMLADTAANA